LIINNVEDRLVDNFVWQTDGKTMNDPVDAKKPLYLKDSKLSRCPWNTAQSYKYNLRVLAGVRVGRFYNVSLGYVKPRRYINRKLIINAQRF